MNDGYPASWETDVVLRDGHTVHVRPIQPDDAAGLADFHGRQSAESVYFRFLSPRPRLSDRELRYFTEIDYVDRMAFVAELDDQLVAVARYERYSGSDTAEVAFFVDDAHHGRGLATVMLEYLAAAARYRGLKRFTASTLPNNRKMLSVFSRAGYDVSSRIEDGVVSLSFGIDPTDASTAAVERRERTAEAATVQRLLCPESVVVVGSGAPGSLASAVLWEIDTAGFEGSLSLLRRGATPHGSDADNSPEPVELIEPTEFIEEVPQGTDLAVVAVEALQVPRVVEECAQADVGAILILSAGFTELDESGAALESEVVNLARRYGVRVLGPDCLGLLNTDPDVRLHATVAASHPDRGPVGMFAESGTLAAAILEECERTGMGVSTFVAGGNRLDVGAADILSFWSSDECTGAVLLYLRSAGLSPRLVRAARSAAVHKPVAVLGNVLVGAGHEPKEIRRRVEALTRQTGVISVGTLEQLLDLGRILTGQPVPRGRGVVVVGNSEGAVDLASDACRGSGLELVGLDGLANPCQLSFRATPQDYRAALHRICSAENVGCVIVVHSPPRLRSSPEVCEVIADASSAFPDICIAAAMLGADESPMIGTGDHRVPVFAFPEHPARALGRLAAYREWASVNRDVSLEPPVGCDLDLARSIVEEALARASSGNGTGDGTSNATSDRSGNATVQLDLAEQERLLDSFAVKLAEREVAADVDAAVICAERIGWPVALKAARRDRGTRSAVSGVAIDLASESDLRDTWARMEEALGDDMHPLVVQRFIERGVDAAITIRRGRRATTIEVGLGGPVTALDEPQLGLLPLSLPDAQALVASSALGRALTDPLDRVALVGVVQRLAHLVVQVEEISCLVADPVVASVRGAAVADVRIEVREPSDRLAVRSLA